MFACVRLVIVLIWRRRSFSVQQQPPADPSSSPWLRRATRTVPHCLPAAPLALLRYLRVINQLNKCACLCRNIHRNIPSRKEINKLHDLLSILSYSQTSQDIYFQVIRTIKILKYTHLFTVVLLLFVHMRKFYNLQTEEFGFTG